jgi:hypothetical protein
LLVEKWIEIRIVVGLFVAKLLQKVRGRIKGRMGAEATSMRSARDRRSVAPPPRHLEITSELLKQLSIISIVETLTFSQIRSCYLRIRLCHHSTQVTMISRAPRGGPAAAVGRSRLILFSIVLHEVVDVIKEHQVVSDAEESRARDTGPCLIKALPSEHPPSCSTKRPALNSSTSHTSCSARTNRRITAPRSPPMKPRSPNGEHQIEQTFDGKKRATREAGVAENNRVDTQTQHDFEMKKGGKVTWVEEEAKELGKVVTKLHTKAEIRERAIKGRGGWAGGIWA